ncbi:MAG: MgtC/SapB family protein [Burkholderiales bacterium]|nr:MgtC/SapB family protein [Burkholderiales bacterium]
MNREHLIIIEHLLAALVAGGLIGFERSFHGRPAGFRTHALVCVASSALMLVTLYGGQWFPEEFTGRVTLDPTRMAQGIMTGIGFLGAGVIFKEGLTVRGLTTAASIWTTAAIGILAGIGFYFPLVLTTVLTLGTLSVFRWVENAVPSEFYAQLRVKFPHDRTMSLEDLARFIAAQGFSIANVNYHYSADERFFEYRAVIRTRQPRNVQRLSEALSRDAAAREFSIRPTGD